MKTSFSFRIINILSVFLAAQSFPAVLSERAISTTRLSAQRTLTRRQWFARNTSALFVLTSIPAAPSHAASADSQRTVYITGKPPKVPGQSTADTNKNSNTQGTRKDPSFLRSISDCKSQCELQGSKSKEDCLSECQDICCKTYEQCTFGIVPRI